MKQKILKTGVNQIMMFVFTLCLFAFLIVTALQRPRVLILHSYDLNYAWTKQVNEGIHRVIDEKQYDVRWYYLDTRRHTSTDFYETAGAGARRIIQDWRPNVLIAVDDNAQEYVARHFINDGTVNIIFSGMNGELSDYGYENANNVTGVLERKPLEATRQALQLIQFPREDKSITSNTVRLLHITDNTSTGLANRVDILGAAWDPVILVDSIVVKTFAEWQAAVLASAEQADLLLITNYGGLLEAADEPDSLVNKKEVIDWTEAHSPIPGISTSSAYVSDGGMLAFGVSPYEQGEVAARMAVQLIDEHVPAKEIPVVEGQQIIVHLNQSSLTAYGIVLPDIFEAFARATGNYYITIEPHS